MGKVEDRKFMHRALELARHGLFSTDPNPRVGCVMVNDGVVVGEAWHEQAGAPHAEVNALVAAGDRARGATAYVSLEPCRHRGRTGPCTQRLVDAGVRRVVAAMVDPNPEMAGRGLAELEAAGIQVASGVLEQGARALNPGFVMRHTQGRPFVRIKLAASLDGRTAMASGESKWITGSAARRDVQRLRARSSAVLTGIGTVLADDPALTVRAAELAGDDQLVLPDTAPRQPLRVVLDDGLRTPADAGLLAQPGATLIVTTSDDPKRGRPLQDAGAEVLVLPARDGRVALPELLAELASREANEVLVEAGATLAGAFVADHLVDEIVVYLAPVLLGNDARGLFALPHIQRMNQRVPLEIVDVQPVGKDWRITAVPAV
jgi:diaminohydroxyphosphoribosylaminopyrimidine deaminase/5-amino-6-(5-phosphoribosylamino)uracil reductase